MASYTYVNPTVPAEWGNAPELCGVSPIALNILAARGFRTVGEIEEFLNPSFPKFMSDTNLLGMDKLVGVLSDAISSGAHIVVYYDYDADGICACAIAYENLRRFGAYVDIYCNRRTVDGYGMCVAGVKSIMERWGDVDYILTVDNGISAHDGITFANQNGIKVLVTDHHEQTGALPDAEVVVNPKRKDEQYPFRDICGAEVILKVMSALAMHLHADFEPVAASADLAGVAVVSDVMPLRGENRAVLREGLYLMNSNARMFFRVLNRLKSIDRVTAQSTISFTYAPMINSLGRFDGDLDRIVMAMVETKDEEMVRSVISDLDEINEERKAETAREEEAAIALCEAMYPDAVPGAIVLYSPEFNEGIVGIVAGRLRERYQRPAILFADSGENGILKGSGRSIEGFDMIGHLTQIKNPALVSFGGHKLAAGMSIRKGDLDVFRDKLCAMVDDVFGGNFPEEVRTIDYATNAVDVTEDAVRGLRALEPYGAGFPEPLIGVRARVGEVFYMGDAKQHVKYVDSDTGMQMILWKAAERERKRNGFPKRFVGTLGLNEFNNRVSVQLVAEYCK